MRQLLAVATACALMGCVTPPRVYDVQRTRELNAPKATVWDRAVRYFAENKFQVKAISQPDGVIHGDRERQFPQDAGNDERRAGFWAGYADCGDVFTSLPEGQKIELNVVLRDEGATTKATINAVFRESYFDLSGWGAEPAPRDCNSTGVLERQVFDALSAG